MPDKPNPQKFTLVKQADRFYITHQQGTAELYQDGEKWDVKNFMERIKAGSEPLLLSRRMAIQKAMLDWFIYSNKCKLPL